MNQSDARLISRDYASYEGDRNGELAACKSLFVFTIKRILGLRRKSRYKILPFSIIAMSYLPAIAYVGIIAIVKLPSSPNAFLAAPYADYYAFVVTALFLFASASAPESLCPDRRDHVLPLYYSSIMRKPVYLITKIASVFVTGLFLTVGPLLLLLIGFAVQGNGPDGFGGFMRVLGSLTASGLIVSMVYTSVAVAWASLSDRRGIASAAVALTFFITSALINVLIEVGKLSENLILIDPATSAGELSRHMYGKNVRFADVSVGLEVMSTLAWVTVALAVAFVTYRRRDAN